MRAPLRGLLIVAVCLLALPARAQQAPVEIALDRFGVGNVVRAGEWAGVRARLVDRTDRPRTVAVRLVCPDPDGDRVVVRRDVTLNPGVAQSVWLYAVLGWGFEAVEPLMISVHEIEEDGSLGRPLGSGPIQPSDAREAEETLIGVVGPAYGGGLSRYTTLAPGRRSPATSHEINSVVGDLGPADLPDRWMGLAQFEALVVIGQQAGDFGAREAEAIMEWVRRGGRLLVSLPADAQSWRSERDNALSQVMPGAEHRRADSAQLRPYTTLLRPVDSSHPLPPATSTLHAFRIDPDGDPQLASPILRGADGAVVAVRRIVGAGEVTLIGFDLSDSALAASIDPQRFWHRLLGNRFDVRSEEELQRERSERNANLMLRDPQWLDRDIPYLIAKTGSAGAGVLLGLGVFALYLVLAGPLGFAILKKTGRERHAWLAFALVAAVFTLVAWGGVASIRPRTMSAQHLTFLDVVYGQTEQRARSWLSVLIPTYGERTISVAGGSPDASNALWPWRDPGAPGSSRFPDSREYELLVRDMSAIRPPTRATVKQVRAEWLGSSRWRTPYTLGESGVRLAGPGSAAPLVGALEHRLPEPLEDVVIVLSLGQTPLTPGRDANGSLPARFLAWRLTGDFSPWRPETPLDLSQLTPTPTRQDYFASLTEAATASRIDLTDPARAWDRLLAASWHGALEPPAYLTSGAGSLALLQRRLTHGLDMARWLTQPSLVVIGRVRDARAPFPVEVDGREIDASGMTVVRWVYPLQPQTPEIVGR